MLENSLKTFRFINYLLIVLIVAALLLLTRSALNLAFTKRPAQVSISDLRGQTQPALEKKNIMQYADILEKNPFGPPMQLRPIAVTEETETGTGTLSDLVLLGTAVGQGKMNYAIFKNKAGDSPQQEEIFKLGDPVFNYGTLKKVESTSVEIERQSKIYTIAIPFENVTPEPESDNRDSVSSRPSFARKVSEGEYILDSDRVQESIENPEHIMTDARLLPNFVDGKQEGFTISEVIPDGLYDSLGMKNGDILLKVNGLEMSNPEVAIQAMTALRGMNRVNLDIIRGGKNMSLSYQLR